MVKSSNIVFISLWHQNVIRYFHFIVFFVYGFLKKIFFHPSIYSFIHSGILNLPAVALGIITGGFVMKRFKLGLIGAARMSTAASLGAFSLLAFQIFIHCDNAEVAGLTVSYQGWVESFKHPLYEVCNWNVFDSMKTRHENVIMPQDQCPVLMHVYLCSCAPGFLKCPTTTRPCCHNATRDAPAQWSIGTQCAPTTEWRMPRPAWLAARPPLALARKWLDNNLYFLMVIDKTGGWKVMLTDTHKHIRGHVQTWYSFTFL